MKKIVMIVLTIVILTIPILSNAAFSDVPEGHWAEEFIAELTNKGVINGYPDGTYGPNDTLTTGQFLKLIVTASLPDIDYDMVNGDFEHWASQYLRIAENYEAVKEGSITKENID